MSERLSKHRILPNRNSRGGGLLSGGPLCRPFSPQPSLLLMVVEVPYMAASDVCVPKVRISKFLALYARVTSHVDTFSGAVLSASF